MASHRYDKYVTHGDVRMGGWNGRTRTDILVAEYRMVEVGIRLCGRNCS